MRPCPLCGSPGVEDHRGVPLVLATASCSNEKCFLHINRQDEANHHVLLEEWEGPPVMHDAVPGARPGKGGANCCHMPAPEEPKMATIYANMRKAIVKAHCADARPAHRCAGAITITRDTITLNCPRCGDIRKTLEKADG